MNKLRVALLIDAVINLILGLLLLAYSTDLAIFFGVPVVSSAFYPNLLGAIFFGISIALTIEAFRQKPGGGLGLIGAICINLCGGIVLLIWLVLGDMDLPVHGKVFLWIIDLSLLMISSLELYMHYKTD